MVDTFTNVRAAQGYVGFLFIDYLCLCSQFLIGQLGRLDLKIAVIGLLLFYCYFRSVYCLSVLFEVMYELFVRCR